MNYLYKIQPAGRRRPITEWFDGPLIVGHEYAGPVGIMPWCQYWVLGLVRVME